VPPPDPVTDPGAALTVITDVAMQPVPVVYVIPVVPVDIAETTPEVLFIVPTAVLLLVHVPPVVVFASPKVDPTQTELPPVMAPIGFTVTVASATQPVPVV
jgi:hypothetical protein